ncbi:MAG: hypothetical protein B7Z27_05655, partial [Sphingobacteriia bacterium 32-37-4]
MPTHRSGESRDRPEARGVAIAELGRVIDIFGIAGDAVDLDRTCRSRVVAAADCGGEVGEQLSIGVEGLQ